MDFRAAAEKQVGRKLTPAEVSGYWSDEAWKHISANPQFAEMMFLRKFMLFWNDYEVPDNLNMYLLARWSWVLRLPLFGIGAIASLALLGTVVAFREKVDARILAAFIAIYCVTVVAFFIFSRYRIQIVPALAVLGAWGVLWLVRQVSAARWENAAGGVAAIAMSSFFCFQTFDWIDKPKAIAISLNNLAAIYSDLGDTPKAIETYEEAAKLSPQGVVGALRVLGDHYLQTGDLDRSEYFMREVITYKPESRMGWEALVRLYTKRKANGESDPALSGKLAEALLGAGRVADARREIDSARASGVAPPADLERRIAAAEAGRR
jgi:tetratricopeptide (TPR) repeat protein